MVAACSPGHNQIKKESIFNYILRDLKAKLDPECKDMDIDTDATLELLLDWAREGIRGKVDDHSFADFIQWLSLKHPEWVFGTIPSRVHKEN